MGVLINLARFHESVLCVRCRATLLKKYLQSEGGRLYYELEETMSIHYNPNASWRDTAREPKLWVFDSRVLPPILVAMFHITTTTFAFALVCVIILQVLAYYGFSVPIFIRYCRSIAAGKRRVATPWWM
jgi:intracellular multiplication protein IcmT